MDQDADIRFRVIADGRHLGFRAGKQSGSWIARFRMPGSHAEYVTATLELTTYSAGVGVVEVLVP
jgi:hypothetical protein